MMKHVLWGAATIVCAGALWTVATAQQAQTPRSTTRTAAQTTLVGCLYRESTIPGRTMTAGSDILDDYILADAASASPSGAGGAVGTSGSVPAAGKLYEIERIADERLHPLVGKRVEVTGYVDADPELLTGAAPDLNDLPEFETTSIREVSGTCPAAPKL
jgi:hypothetical protein